MAATLVGGAFLSATVQTLVEKLASQEFCDYIRNTKLNSSLFAELETTLLALQAVLDDAEHKQITNTAVKQWLDQLKDAIYDAEDLLNQINYDSLRCTVEKKQAENMTNQVWNLFSSPFKNLYGEINSQMKIMCQRLQIFAQQRDILGLQTVSGRVSLRTPSSSMVNESVMVGRKDDKERLISMLISDSGTTNSSIGVVAILGMGGVGKTTLAQLLYNDKEVQDHFDLKVWVCVSEDFDILRVTKTIHESVTSRGGENNNLDFLRVELNQNLRDKRFLLVLDDLWNDSYNDWDELVTPLINGKTGSMVIITTRQQKVAEVAHTFPIHKVDPLSDDDCWSLLSKHAFGSEDRRGRKYPNLEEIGRKIAKKCGGLPIAAKTLGGILRSKVDAKEWTAILNSDIWNLPNDNILPALRLSYQYLPSHLKRCFAYCSIFPKDFPLDKKELILLWMAEGFLEHSQRNKTAEEVGHDYFIELLSRSLIQQSNDDGKEKFVMHDLVNDLALVVSGTSCFRLECGGNMSKNVRHLSYNQGNYDFFKKFEVLYNFKCLRSFLPINLFGGRYYLSRKVVEDLIPKLKRLRVLSLKKYKNINLLPESVGSLVELRYLDLSFTGIKSLPNATCNLYNLQTLNLTRCENLTELPPNFGKLINLRHLDISETNIKEMPMQIVGLNNLQTLTVFSVGKQDTGLSLKEVCKFPNLRGKLCIKNLQNVIDAIEAYDVNMRNKEDIEELELQWSKQTEDSRIEKDVLDMLQPSFNLRKLSIRLYGGTSFPSWLGDPLFSNMVSLCISNCEYCVTLPPLGQLPSLKDLTIKGMTMETIGLEFYGMTVEPSISSFQPFQSLEILHISDMPNWKEWKHYESGEFGFPRLRILRLIQCPKLRGHLPGNLPSIDIHITGCDSLLTTPPTTLHWLSSLNEIFIDGCSFNREQCKESLQWLLLEIDSPCVLQSATIRYCDTLFSLPRIIRSSICLRFLELHHLPSLAAFPTHGLPTSLQSLTVDQCPNLAFLPLETWGNYTSLVTLDLNDSCYALTSFLLDGFPALQDLCIDGCKNLESIFISESSSDLPSTLQLFEVLKCDALRSLTLRMDTLISLEHLFLRDLPELTLQFCKGACLPPKLRSINIKSVRIATPVDGWGLQHLTSLSRLYIGGNDVDDIVNTLLKERLLPISLVSLDISNLCEIQSFDGNGLGHLSSLKTLGFYNCSRLESLSKDTFPSSLKILRIMECPLLEANYKSQRWEQLSIPVLEINGEVII
ncbi:putative P-loop containing nucleoside triphosphate hydrolase, leucine-rich repeat domain, L [Medicago truncatula]|uniref:NB-ARC domain disease resistance protein, putative n=1 Tax=Medicago truncatula TaxID=3880 RepID=G7J119_MEDTR|nr:putative disease resistance RPP13-like protein 1 [Medicago truncatula]AES69847.1 NB-ARC domain disease resistance protein, putative [Medicago truncatula]RHN66441.1 putative P-loop containing nucleoside triphosphate hydrolase, leucine-rich repeat domain, L [Medicago truncatula]